MPLTARNGTRSRMLLACGLFLASAVDALAQVFILNVNRGNNFIDIPGTNYPSATQPIIRVTGPTATYQGSNISGSTVATSNAFHGANAQNGGTITFSGTTIFTLNNTGNTAYPFFTQGNNSRIIADIALLTAGTGANLHGIRTTGTGSEVTLNQASITTRGVGGAGVVAEVGTTVNLGTASTIVATAATGAGHGISAVGGTVNANDLTIATNTTAASGVNITASGIVNLGSGSSIQTNAASGSAHAISAATGTMTATDLTLTTTSASAHGINAATNANITLGGATTINAGGIGINAATGATVTANGPTGISSAGFGVQASASTVNLNAVGNTITTSGAGTNSSGVNLTGANPSVSFGQVDIRTSGASTPGVRLVGTGTNSLNLGTGSRVQTTGTTAAGLTAGNGAAITATDLTILTNPASTGVGLTVGTTSIVNLLGTTTIASGGTGLTAGASTAINDGINGRFVINTFAANASGVSLTGASANLGTGSTINTVNGVGVTLASGASATASGLSVTAGGAQNGISAATNANITLGGATTITAGGIGINAATGATVTANGPTGISSASFGVQASASTVNLNAVGNTITTSGAGNNGSGVNLTGANPSVSFGQVDIRTSGASAPGVRLVGTGTNSLNLGTGSRIQTTGTTAAGLTAGNGAAITATDLTILTNSASTGVGLTVGTTSIVNLLGTTTIASGGTGLTAGASTAINNGINGRFVINTFATNASGVSLTGASANLGTGSTINTVNGVGVTLASGASVTASGLSVTAGGAQNGINLVTGSATLNGDTTVRSGGIGLRASRAGVVVRGGALDIETGIAQESVQARFDAIAVQGGTAAQPETTSVDIEADSIRLSVRNRGSHGARVTGTGAAAFLRMVSGSTIDIALTNPDPYKGSTWEAAGIRIGESASRAEIVGDLNITSAYGRGSGLWNEATSAAGLSIVGNVNLSTTNDESFGIRQDQGNTRIDGNTVITTSGQATAGIRATNGVLALNGDLTIDTTGNQANMGGTAVGRAQGSYGIWNTVAGFTNPVIDMVGTAIAVQGATNVTTSGTAAFGVFNDTVSGKIDLFGPATVTTSGAPGRYTYFTSKSGTTVLTAEAAVASHAVNNNGGTTTFHDTAGLTATGPGASAVFVTGGDVIFNAPSTLRTEGTAGHGIQVTTARGSTRPASLTFNAPFDIATAGSGADAIFASNHTLTLNDGGKIRIADPSAKSIRALGTASVQGQGRYDIVGDIAVSDSANVTLNMSNRSQFTGATSWSGPSSALDISLSDQSAWSVTGNSRLRNLSNAASSIAFAPPNGGSFKTLTVSNYAGASGVIGVHTELGGDGSPSDRLVIDGGSATGDTLISVTRAGGFGAVTTGNGILLVDAVNGGTTATTAFAANPIVAGPFEYNLYRGSVDASGPNNWYLRTKVIPPIPPIPPVPPVPPVPPPVPAIADYRREVSLFAALPAMGMIYGRTLLDTLHERVGDEEQLRGRTTPGSSSYVNGAWGRIIGQHGNVDGGPWGIYRNGPNYTYDLFALQAGLDIYRKEHAGGSRDHGGLYAAVGEIDGRRHALQRHLRGHQHD